MWAASSGRWVASTMARTNTMRAALPTRVPLAATVTTACPPAIDQGSNISGSAYGAQPFLGHACAPLSSSSSSSSMTARTFSVSLPQSMSWQSTATFHTQATAQPAANISTIQRNTLATTTTNTLPTTSQHQLQLVRHRWTKAKKKRHMRYLRKQAWEAKGKPWPKPANYLPVSTPVVNAVSQEDQKAQKQAFLEEWSVELRERMDAQHQKSAAALQKQPLLYPFEPDLEMSDRVRKVLSLANGNQRQVLQAQKAQAMELFQMRDGDTGSTSVQIIALTSRIQQMQTHRQLHPKDKSGKRGMDAMYVRRRKLLDYLQRKDYPAYTKVVQTLGLNR